jgi:hypothetical protein
MFKPKRRYAEADGPNRWKGFVLGLVGGAAGVCAMNTFMAHSSELFKKLPGDDLAAEPRSASLVGKQHREGESSTAALGRILYRQAAGSEPQSEELKSTLSNLVHWGYGIAMGGAWGALCGESSEVKDGVAYGSALWLAGDEAAVPLLGLSSSPASFPPSLHAQTFAAHCIYGAVTAATTGLLQKALG